MASGWSSSLGDADDKEDDPKPPAVERLTDEELFAKARQAGREARVTVREAFVVLAGLITGAREGDGAAKPEPALPEPPQLALPPPSEPVAVKAKLIRGAIKSSEREQMEAKMAAMATADPARLAEMSDKEMQALFGGSEKGRTKRGNARRAVLARIAR